MKKNSKKFKNHCHFTIKFCGAAHSMCYPQCKGKTFISMIQNNASGHDNYLILSKIAGKV